MRFLKKIMADKKAGTPKDKSSKETAADLKNETVKKDGVKKGYNEKNPTQPQGAFPADSKK
jgi:hypothetical protein